MSARLARVRHALSRPWLRRTLIGLVCLPFVLVGLVLTALAVPFTRKPIVALALDITNDSLDGMRIELDAVDRLDLWGIELRGARLFDEKRREMVSVKSARVRIAPLALVTGTLSLRETQIEGTRIHLYPTDAPEEEEEEKPPSEPSSFQILAHQLQVRDLTFDMDLSGKALHAELAELSAHGAYGPKTRAAVDELTVSADLDGERALDLRSEHAQWDEKKGGQAALSGELAGAALRIVYVVPAIDDRTRWPVRRAELHLTGLRNQGLARLGYGDAAQLRVPVDLHVKAATSGPGHELLSAQLDLHAGNARLALTARASPSSYAAELALKPVNLAQISGVLPQLSAGLRLSAELRHDVAPMPLRVAWSEAWLDGRAVPSGNLRARLALPRIELERLRVAGLEEALSLRGAYDVQSGAANVALETHEFQLASLGGLLPEGTQGAVNGTLQASYAGRKLSGDGALSLRYFRMPDVAIDNASLALDLSGTLSEPRGEFKLAAYQIESGETKIRRVAVSAAAGLRDVDANLEVDGHDRVVALVLTGKRADDGTLTISGGGRGRIKDRQLGLTLKELRIEKDRYAVEELSAFSGKERLYLSGSFAGGSAIDASLQIANLNLGPWTRLFLEQPITGQLDLTARAGGRIDAPVAEVKLDVRRLHSERTPRAPVVELSTLASLDMIKRRATLSLDTHSQDRRVALKLTAEAQLARPKALAQAFQRAKLKLDLNGHTDVPFLAQFAEAQLGALEGTVSADVSISGGMDGAEMYAKFASELTPREERNKLVPDRIDLDIVLKPRRLDVDLIVQDKFGRVVDLTSNAALPEGGPNALLAQGNKLMHTPVVLKLLVNERRLDKLQGSLGVLARSYGAALPVRAKAQIDLESTGQAITGKVMARAHAWGEGLDDACDARAEGDLSLSATLAGDQAQVELKAQPSGGGEAEVTLASPLAVNNLLDGSAFAWGPATLRARGRGLALQTMPMLCMLPASRTNFELTADNLGKAPLDGKLSVEVCDIETSDGPISVALTAQTAPDAVGAQGKLALRGKEMGRFSAKVPLAYKDSPLPSVPLDKPFQAGLDLPDFPLAGLTSFTDVVGRAGGRVRANLVAKGTLASPDPSGVIELKDASFSIASLAQPFSDVNARLELAPDKLVIRKLSARDRGGKLGMVGYARYNPTRGGEMELHLSADKFPIRQQGSIIGELTTRAVLEGKIDARQQMQLVLDLKEGRIWLTGEGGQQVQELDEHPDIRFDTDRLALAEEPLAEPETELTLALLRIKSNRDLWLMHEDFAVQVGVDMRLTHEEDGFTMGGEATITRGDLNLLGKPFRIERGAVRFTGDVPPDPELDLKAKHTTRQGKTLIVQIQGRGSAPQIIFSGAARNAGEAAALLSGIGGSGAESKAKTDAASFAAGLTAGLLAVSARRRFGDWVPMLAVENNAQGRPSGARAGFDASRLIPKFMRGFARGMFVEGVVGTRSDTQQRGVGVGVRVEVALPSDFMTSMGYGPGTVWSTDVYWSP